MFQWLLQMLGKIPFFTGALARTGSFLSPLEKQEEDDLLSRVKQGDKFARDKLVEHNMRLVAHVAKKYKGAAEQDDLISVGSLGLAKAVDTFSPEKGTSLATFAARCIENEILMLIRAGKKHKATVSLYDEVGTDKDGNTLQIIDTLSEDEDTVFQTVNERLMANELQEKMQKSLSKREYRVLSMRFGLNGGAAYAQREVAKKLNISRSYVSRIEKKAILKLRKVVNKEDFGI